MPSIECPPTDQLTSLLSGEVDPALTEQITSHLDSCSACQERVAKIQGDEDATPDPEVSPTKAKAKSFQDKYGWVAVLIAWLLGIAAAEYLPDLTRKPAPAISVDAQVDHDNASKTDLAVESQE